MLAEIKSSLALKKNKSEEAFRKIQSTGHTSLPGLFKKKKKKQIPFRNQGQTDICIEVNVKIILLFFLKQDWKLCFIILM